MKPIPKSLLIHSATLLSVVRDEWQSETLNPIATLKNVRFEPLSKLVTDKQNRQITISAVLFFDCRSSTPKDVRFSHGQKIKFGENEYTIEVIEPIYDNKKLHHYEIGLV